MSLLLFAGRENVFLKTDSSLFGEKMLTVVLMPHKPCQAANVLDHELGRVTACLRDPPGSCFLQNTVFSEAEALFKISWDSSRSLVPDLESLSPVSQSDSTEVRRSAPKPHCESCGPWPSGHRPGSRWVVGFGGLWGREDVSSGRPGGLEQGRWAESRNQLANSDSL